jgi:hypothetical protein
MRGIMAAAAASARYDRAMAILLLNLRHVPDDEADEVRALLDAQGIDYYETRPGPFGISAGGLWLADPLQEERARLRLQEYQDERSRRAHEEREAERREGRLRGTWGLLRENPLQAVATVLGILFVLAVTLLPFVFLGR